MRTKRNIKTIEVVLDPAKVGEGVIRLLRSQRHVLMRHLPLTVEHVIVGELGIMLMTPMQLRRGLTDQSIVAQSIELKRRYPRSLLIVEGAPPDGLQLTRTLEQGVIALMGQAQMPVLRSSGIAQTAAYLSRIAEQEIWATQLQCSLKDSLQVSQ
jgi:hypothetical protein